MSEEESPTQFLKIQNIWLWRASETRMTFEKKFFQNFYLVYVVTNRSEDNLYYHLEIPLSSPNNIFSTKTVARFVIYAKIRFRRFDQKML